ncbi:MSHA biogenesis protein MshM [Ferrimonas sediminum]|uniref:MSHA biogenesis protein MshM n=1 Tax=Ferrimonas sediminum TaxID=718193 RepID=A0A1G8K809_9GAMM|nr:AAA family ATPase [Ferrimonas sediminum]SDI39543.1 MSHA biogenesis protein MshM [Ferrimonas sediminum]
MYLYHFGLRELPFSLTPNTQFFMQIAPHVEALQVLHTALAAGEGFIKVTGEVGTGKTLLCRKMLNELGNQYQIAYLPNPCLSADELRRAVASELGIAQQQDQHRLTEAISHRLLQLAGEGKRVVLLLDEAQALPDESLEALRLFTNLETEYAKLLQVVLFGQPELDRRLADTHFRQLRQRITFSYQLRGLTLQETCAYVEHRLAIAGYKGQPLFSWQQMAWLHRASNGIPRLVNVLCHKTLMLAYGAGVQGRIDNAMVQAAVADTESAYGLLPWWRENLLMVMSLMMLTLAAAGLGLSFYLEGGL